ILIKGGKIDLETRGYDEVKQVTFLQRSKEEAHDYRYFPEPDLPPIRLEQLTINNLQLTIPELPQQKRIRLENDFVLPKDFAEILVSDKNRADYFEEVIKLGSGKAFSAKTVADLMINKRLDYGFPEPAGFARKILEMTSVEYASQQGTEIAIIEVMAENQKAVSDYKNGKGEAVGFLIGMVQKKLKGKGNPGIIRESVLKNLQK
ncbi:MAG: hypothetical protein NTZ07_03665, partial [Candidatus Woesebacteria bacterium]|nr:hypothetical protein [Candidatus Woesebacteria bacterium]